MGQVALTFDDGPGRVTEAVLDALAATGASATFNVLGGQIAGRQGLLRRAVAEGHELGNHGWSHARLAGRPLRAAPELGRTLRAVRSAAGVRTRVFRAPYGAVSPGVLRVARSLGMTTIGWDVDPRDWELPGAAAITERVLSGVRDGSIVSLHDGRRAQAQTAEALPAVLQGLSDRGLAPVTASQLLASRSDTHSPSTVRSSSDRP